LVFPIFFASIQPLDLNPEIVI